MNLSGILVITPPEHLEAMIATLNGLPGVEVHHSDPGTGRIVVVQEADSVDAGVAGLRRIQSLPAVALAEMVYHYFGEDVQLSEPVGDAEALPAGLSD
jgi:nitrate reductase NapD